MAQNVSKISEALQCESAALADQEILSGVARERTGRIAPGSGQGGGKNGCDNGKNGGDKGGTRRLTTFGGGKIAVRPWRPGSRAPRTHATLLKFCLDISRVV